MRPSVSVQAVPSSCDDVAYCKNINPVRSAYRLSILKIKCQSDIPDHMVYSIIKHSSRKQQSGKFSVLLELSLRSVV